MGRLPPPRLEILWISTGSEAVAAGARSAARLRAVEDRTPTEVAESQRLDEKLHKEVAGVARVFDLWTAEAFDPDGFKGARDEALRRGAEIIATQESLLGEKAGDLARREQFLHWPLAFADDANFQSVTRQISRPKRTSDVVEVDDLDSLHARDAVEIEIPRDHTTVQLFAQLNESLIDRHPAIIEFPFLGVVH